MNQLSIGDLAHSFLLRRQSAGLKSDLSRLSTELASGRTTDTNAHLGGRFAALAEYERSFSLLTHQEQVVAEVQTQASTLQLALETVQGEVGGLTDTLALASAAASSSDRSIVANEADARLNTILSALNTQVAGRAILSGTSVSSTPLASAETLLSELRIAVSTATTAADILTAADTFFDAAGGPFETLVYQGGTQDLQPFEIGEGETVSLSLRADDSVLRDTLKTLALAALADDPGLALDTGEAKNLLQSLTETALTGQDAITGLRADLGFAEERIDAARVRIASERSGVDIARLALLEVDPFQTATELENVQVQLETLYTITARSARLSLVNFLS